MLREGFLGGYHFRKFRSTDKAASTKYAESPDKNEYSHIHDALQYGCLLLRSSGMTNALSSVFRRGARREVRPAKSWVAYT
jgi:hypothetical protein